MAEGTDDICKKRGSIDLERDVILSEANTEEAGGEETAHKHKGWCRANCQHWTPRLNPAISKLEQAFIERSLLGASQKALDQAKHAQSSRQDKRSQEPTSRELMERSGRK